MNINEWVKKVHETAKNHGWWDLPRDEEEICQLFITEIAEASECARTGEPPVHYGIVPYLIEGIKTTVVNNKYYLLEPWKDEHNSFIKAEGEAIEMVDLLIRLGDWFGHNGWELGNDQFSTFADTLSMIKKEIAGENMSLYSSKPLANHFELVCFIVDATEKTSSRSCAAYVKVFLSVLTYMVFRGWDVEKAISIKQAYNETRTYRHGGKLV